MGYQQAVPPVPTRLEEIKALDRLEKSWLDQPFYKYYMQEDLRQLKMNYHKVLNQYQGIYWLNFLICGTLMAPLVFVSRRFFVYSRGNSPIPFVASPKYYEQKRTPQQLRQYTYFWKSTLVWLFATAMSAHLISDTDPRSDQFYNKFTKKDRMM